MWKDGWRVSERLNGSLDDGCSRNLERYDSEQDPETHQPAFQAVQKVVAVYLEVLKTTISRKSTALTRGARKMTSDARAVEVFMVQEKNWWVDCVDWV